MNRSKIEWLKSSDGKLGFTINPVKGLCPVACPYCYARAMYKRFKWNSEIRFDISVFDKCGYLEVCHSDPQRIFVGSTMELFGDWIKDEWLEAIFDATSDYPNHRFLFLTKQPQNLIKWSPFPENCFVGATVTNQDSLSDTLRALIDVDAKTKFLSLEPLLGEINVSFYPDEIQWVIIGQQTPVSAKTEPKVEWVREIVNAADKAGIRVFLKDNLRGLLPKEPPFYTKCCAEVNSKDPCYEEPCLSERLIDECSKAPNFWMLRQEMPE